MMNDGDVIYAETLAMIDGGDEAAMRDFRNMLTEAAEEIDNALYELTVDGGTLEGGGA